MDYLDHLNYQRKAKPQGYADGGAVGGRMPSLPIASNGARNVNVNIINHGEPAEANVKTKETDNGLEITVELMRNIARTEAGNMLQQNLRPGGILV